MAVIPYEPKQIEKGEETMSKKLIKQSLGESIANIIRERIILGEYPPGMKLKEEQFAEEFELSRICVREALLILDREGLLDKKLNRGSCVCNHSAKDVEDLLSYRVVLEVAAAVGCIEKGCVPKRELSECIEKMDRLRNEETPSAEFLEADIVFHDTLIHALGNEYIDISWDAVRSQYLMLMNALYKVRSFEFHEDGRYGHSKLLNLLLSGDKEKLTELLRLHIMSNCESISRFVCD